LNSEIGEQLLVGLGVHDRDQRRNLSDLGEVALAEIIVRSHGKRSELAEPARHVLDVLVQAEDLHGDQDHRRVSDAGGAREIDGHVAARNRYLRFACGEAGGVGLDGVGAHRTRGERKAGGGCGGRRHEAAPRQRRNLGQADDILHLGLHVHVQAPCRSLKAWVLRWRKAPEGNTEKALGIAPNYARMIAPAGRR
jgi:hypothetical protein